MKKGILNQPIQTHELKSLEQQMIYTYLQAKKLNYEDSQILTSYFKDFEQNQTLHFEATALNISNIKELENHLELIIPISDRKFNGAFFTPDYVIDFIISEIKPKESDKNFDPSCGCGAFLVGLAEYYKKTFNKAIKNIVKENIFGSDILEYNILRAKLILAIYALQNGEYLTESDFNLFHKDSLKENWSQNFDNVVGNPPYVKFQDLSKEYRDYLTENWTTVEGGTFNLYFAFFELGYKLLKPSGKLGYITPNNYFTSLAGESLRKYFQNQQCVTRIVDFSHKKVFDAQTYTAITFLNKQKNDSITYDRIKPEYTPELFLKKTNGSLNYLENLNIKKWRLLKSDEQKNIKTIENIGTPIGKLFEICVGIATLKDDVYFIDGSIRQNQYYIKETSNGIFEIEKDCVRPVYKISDFKSQEETEQNTRKIIFPYSIINGTATPIKDKDFRLKYPKCYFYLLSEKDKLLKRDKGKVKYEPFYVWGRTQGLKRTGKKILTPTFTQKPRFLLVNEEESYFTNGYGIFFRENTPIELFSKINPITKIENIDVVQKILNSIIMDYYVTKTSVAIEGGYPCYQKNFIEKFTIPDLSEHEIRTLRNLKNLNDIDNFLIEKYQLNLPATKPLVVS
jgi:methylase of polypeptide subunit release factors